MSNSSDYTITSLSSSIEQRTFKNGATRAPFSIAVNGRISLRGGCIPYLAFPGGSVPAYPPVADCNDVVPPTPPPLNIDAGYGSGINKQVYGPEVSVGGGGLPILVKAWYGKGINKQVYGPTMGGGELMVKAWYGKGINKQVYGPKITGGAITINAWYGKGINKQVYGPEISG